MEDSKVEERKNFMKRKQAYKTTNLALHSDPLRKREEFAVHLRKKKTSEIINAKRRRMADKMEDTEEIAGSEHV